jgi:hypothetical protein
MNWRPVAVLLLALPLAACVTARPLTLPDGSHGVAIRCNGAALDISSCYEQAGKSCPNGYDVMGANQESTPVLFASQYSLVAGRAAHRSLMVRCK